MSQPRIAVPIEALAELCRARHIQRLSLFGSVLRDDFGPLSDIDVLVEFAPGQAPGLMAFSAIQREIEQLFGGRRVDLVTPGFLHRGLRERVIASSQVQYAA
ncbi:MAG: nucleotidyltransferase domain-containing protein [Pseudomonadota bacterium]